MLVPRFDKSALNGRGDQVGVGSLEVGDLEDQQLISNQNKLVIDQPVIVINNQLTIIYDDG